MRDNLRYLKGMDSVVQIQDGLELTGTGTASYLKPPVLTTTQRDAIVSPANGMVIFNSTDTKLQKYEGTWRSDMAYGGTLTYLSVPSMAQGDIFYADTGTSIARLGAGTSGYVLKTQGTAANPLWDTLVLGASGYTDILASNDLFKSADTERTSLSATYVKVKEIKLDKGGTIRIYFELKRGAEVNELVYARIYRNGVAVGTERSTTSLTYTNFSEDLGGWGTDSLCQLYIHNESGALGATAYAQYFRLRGYASVIPGATVQQD